MQFAAFPGAGISIHALREEGDASASSTSTAPPNFYPRPPRGGRPRQRVQGLRKGRMSKHAHRGEGGASPTPRRSESNQFLSTPSARRATPKAVKASVTMSISIHALREEGDRRLGAAAQVGEGISIHALREEGDELQ